MPPSVVVMLLLDAAFLVLSGLYALALGTSWATLDGMQRAVFLGTLALCVGLVAVMVGLVRRWRWARALNLVAIWVPMAFWVAVAISAALTLAGIGDQTADAGFGLFYAVIFGLTLAAPVAAATGLLVAAPGLRAWLGVPVQ